MYGILVYFAFFSVANAKTIGELVDSTQSYLECKNLSWFENAICEEVAANVNESLNSSGITFNNGDIERWTIPLVPPQYIPTGHSCTHTAQVTDSHAKITLLGSGQLSFSGNSVSEPKMFVMNLPVSVYAKVGFKEQWGRRTLFGHCNEYATDNYYADMYANTTIYQAMLFSLEPRLLEERTASGDYIIEISPLFHVDATLDDFSANFNVNGRSPFSSIITFLSGTNTFMASGAFDLLTWDKEGFKTDLEAYGYDLAYSILHGVMDLGDIISDTNYVEKKITNFVNSAAQDYASYGLVRDKTELETKIYSKISNALQLDNEGKRRYIVKKEVVDGKLMAGILPALMLLN